MNNRIKPKLKMSQSIKILLLESDQIKIDLIKNTLEKARVNSEFYIVTNQEEYLAGLKSFKADIIISDHTLTNFNSIEALEILKEFGKKIPFILVSGHIGEEFAVKVIKIGAFDYVLKDNLTRLPLAIDSAIKFHKQEKEKFQAQLELVKSEEKHRLLISQASDAIFYLDSKGRFIQINERATKMLGFSEGDFFKMNVLDLIPADEINDNPDFISRIESGDELLFERNYLHKNGTKVAVEVNAKKLTDGNYLSIVRNISDRKRNEGETLKANIRLEISEEVSKTGFWEYDCETKKSLWSTQTYKHFNLEPNAELPTLAQIENYILPEDKNSITDSFALAIQGYQPQSKIFRTNSETIGLKYLYTIWHIEKDSAGKPVKVFGIIQDITQSVLLKEILIKSEAEYKKSLDRITDGFVSLNENWDFTYMNKKGGEIFNVDPEKLIGKHISTLFTEGQGKPFVKAYSLAMKSQKHVFIEEFYPPFEKWFENHIYPSTDGLSIYFRDVTTHKEAELELKSHQKLAEKIFESNMIGLKIWNNKGEITDANTYFLNQLGYTPKDLKEGKIRWDELTPPEYADVDADAMQKVVDTGYCPPHEKEYFKKDGTRLPVLVAWASLSENLRGDGIAYMIDISARKIMQFILDEEKSILELINKGESLSTVLNQIALSYQKIDSGSMCSIQLLDITHKKIEEVFAPSFKSEYADALIGLEIGEKVGSCGTAAYRARSVYVSNVFTNPLWEKYRHLTDIFKFTACWSAPIFDNQNKVLGTFAIYYPDEREATPSEIEIIDRFSNLVKVALGKTKDKHSLKTSEDTLGLVLESVSDAFITLDKNWIFLNINKVAAEIIGKNNSELLGKNIWREFPESEPLFRHYFEKARFQNELVFLEEYYPPFEKWFAMHVYATHEDLNIYFKDITKQKNAQNEIYVSHQRLKHHFYNSPLAVIEWGKNNDIIKWSEQAEAIFGWNESEVIGRKIGELNLVYQEDKEKVEESTQELMTGNESKSRVTNRNVTKSGKVIHCTWFTSVLKDNSNNIVSVVSLVHDVTSQVNAELATLESQKKLQFLTDHIPFYIAYVNTNHEYIFVNKPYADLFDLDTENIVGKKVFDVLGDEISALLIPYVTLVFEGQKTNFIVNLKENPIKIKPKFDFVEIVHVSYIPDFNENHQVVGFIVAINDITEIKKAEASLESQNQQLVKTNKELDRFVYSASHDLRAPLTSVLGLVDLISYDTNPENTEQIKRLNMMKKSVVKLDNFIEDILNYSKNSRLDIHKDSVEFDKLIKEISQSHQFMMGADSMKLILDINQESEFVSDYQRLKVVLNNIISNAVKYKDINKKESLLKISVHCDSDFANIEIEDNGIGIKKEDLDKVFDMFYRATKLSTGSGLGLYIVKETIDKMEGEIEIISTENMGTTFKLKFPNLLS